MSGAQASVAGDLHPGRGARGRWRLGLRQRLTLMIFAVIGVILVGQTIVSLSNELTAADRQLSSEGTILAQSAASACVELMGGTHPQRFEPLIERIRAKVDLILVEVVDGGGRIVGHSDRRRIGRAARRPGALALVRPRPGVGVLWGEPPRYDVEAPIARGTEVVGAVRIAFRSPELARRAAGVLLVSGAMTAGWFLLGAVLAGLFVRRITRPLIALTEATQAMGLAEVGAEPESATPARRGPRYAADEIGDLQRAFDDLVERLRRARSRNAALVEQLTQLSSGLRQRVEQTTADLQRSTRYLEAVLGSMQEGVISCDRGGVIVRVNRAAMEQVAGLGEPRAGTTLAEIIPDGGALLDAARRAVAEERPQSIELERSAGRTRRTLVFELTPLAGQAGEALGVVVTVVDVTAQRQMEAQLRRHDRLISLGTIAAGLAHELGNYMHAIQGFSALLLQRIPPEDRRHAEVEAIHRENARAVELLDRFLQFARPREVLFVSAEIDDVVRSAIELSQYQLARGKVEVIDRLASGARVSCDVRLIEQVFINLALNAADAMMDRELRRLTVSSRRRGPMVEISVADTGCGIAAERRERIFDPFYTTKQSGGTGLGLAISHQIVDRHGGRIFVSGNATEGATFVVELPTEEPPGRRGTSTGGDDGGEDLVR